jgi:type IX secretion system PorP/SprF family membrane protein
MRPMLRKLLILIFVGFSGTVLAQDPEFTQFYANPLYLNPAFAGSTRCPRISLNYRNQWPALSGTFVTYSASYDQYVDVLGGGIGLLVLNDKAGEGTLTTSNISAVYAYQLNVTRDFPFDSEWRERMFRKKLIGTSLHSAT